MEAEVKRTKAAGKATLPVPTAKPTKRTTMPEWAGRINAAWQKTVAGIIKTGQLLIEAKADLGHGNFETLLSNRLNADFFFAPRAAQMLMTVARHPVLTNPKFISHLPPSWGTLYEIAAMPIGDEDLVQLIESGKIHPEMTRSDVKKIAAANIDQFIKSIWVLEKFSRNMSPAKVAYAIRHSTHIEILRHYRHSKLMDLPDYIYDILNGLYEMDKEDGLIEAEAEDVTDDAR